ncbi:TIGR03885 family FMN-dependent LLM class oxidoreductase [Pseudocnuella soli]|uniref:TIGR03885 family FMN-dependent LLM class oxidoreductase n=1 Tax=Pseudocnuella soli TaxID=2502779 RepID=UPI001043B982|nr:TIGR03885 family FMN-dependent LLM class oxidoreductase [Pseudocnuella soli]
MAILGYQASHEQFTPSELLRWAHAAEGAGFAAVNSSDHFYPWSERQGQSGFSFAWLGAAMQATTVPYGLVCTPGYRYHPAVVAQAIATLCELFPGRFWISLGSGEALNEAITGEKWPIKSERNERLFECASIIRRLLHGETVTHHGRVTVEEARLYTLPKQMPLLIGAAVTAETAGWVGSWADGLITVHRPYDELKEVVDAFKKGGGEGKPMYLKSQISYAATQEAALAGAYDQWRTNIFHGTVLGDLSKVEQFDALGEMVQPEELKDMVRISSSIKQHIEWIEQDISLGFELIVLHNVNREQDLFIKDFGEMVLPRFHKTK